MGATEVDLVKDLMIGLLILEFAMLVFSAAVGHNLPINSPSLVNLNSTMASINQAGKNLGNSWCTSTGTLGTNSSTVITAANRCSIQSSDFWGAGLIVNLIWGFLGFLKNIFLLIVTDAGALIILLFEIIPGLLSSSGLGAIGELAGYFFAAVTSILGFYFIYLITLIFGIRKTTGH